MTAEICKSKKSETVLVCDVGCSPFVCYFCECFVLVSVVTQWPLDLEYIVSRVAEEKIKVGCVYLSKGCGRQGECVWRRGI